MIFKHRVDGSDRTRKGFALPDLLVVIAVCALLGQIAFIRLSRARDRSQALVCMNNMRLLIGAWQMYQDNNRNVLIEVYHGGEAQNGTAAKDPKKSPWATGWLTFEASSDNTNTALIVDDRYSKFARYFGNEPRIVKCPSDNYLGAAQRSRGWKSRVRTYSANVGIGAGNAESGPWSQQYIHVKTLFEIPDPAMTFVHIEENPQSLNDPAFFNPSFASAFLEQPASFHGAVANLSFVDGHTEAHRWKASLSRPPAKQVQTTQAVTAKPLPGDEDMAWLSARGGLRNPDVWVGAPLR